MMLSKAQIRFIRSLHQAKYRDQERMFLAEGHTLVRDFLFSSIKPYLICIQETWQQDHPDLADGLRTTTLTDEKGMQAISLLSSPSPVLGVFHKPALTAPDALLQGSALLYLDGIRDPGNMGTLLRTADWFGMKEVVMSPDCADPFNPKVVQSSMGSLAHLSLRIAAPAEFFSGPAKGRQVLGALLEGDSIYHFTPPQDAILVIGNESQGIRTGVLPWITRKVTIPRAGQDENHGAESLNAAIAGGILMAWMKDPRLNTSTQ